NLSLLHISSGNTQTDSTNTLHFRHTTGLYSTFKSEGINYRANIYYQTGSNNLGQNVQAYLFDADLFYKLGKTRIGLGLSLLSGDENTIDETDRTFDVLYGARHRYFGHMDYFSNFSSQTKRAGLIDIYGYLGYKISDKIQITNTGHYFSLEKTNEISPEGKNLGYENEIELKIKISESVSLIASYLFFLPTENFKQITNLKAKDFQQFAFVEITIKPILFKQQ
ncbi:MAG: alginate export family protein, partial [Bacteroidales bacterium]|nr:alginate export family protein [Bacteroidales bacterium]